MTDQIPPVPLPADAAEAAEAARFRRRLYFLAAITVIGLAVLTARLVWLQAM